MLVVVAIHAQQLPVATVGRIVVMIVIAVMNRQFAQVGAREFARTAAADPRIHFQGLFAVAQIALSGMAQLITDHLVEFGVIGFGFLGAHLNACANSS